MLYSNRIGYGGYLTLSWFRVFVVLLSLTVMVFATGSALAATKWNPGHYVLYTHTKSGPSQIHSTVLTNPYFKGIVFRTTWNRVEPRKGVYDFSEIERYLAVVKKYNKHLMVRISDSSFNPSCVRAPIPSYLFTAEYGGGFAKMKNGCVARRWDPAVVDRKIALIKAFSKRFNSDPNFEALSFSGETSIAIYKKGTQGASDYSMDKYIAERQRLAISARKIMPNTMYIVGVNFLGGGDGHTRDLERLVRPYVKYGVSLSHPDTYTTRTTPGDEIMARYKGILPIMPANETWGLSDADTEEAMYQKNVKELGASHIIWLKYFSNARKNSQRYIDRNIYLTKYVEPVVNAHKGATNTRCPKSIAPCVSTSGKAKNINFADVGNGFVGSKSSGKSKSDKGSSVGSTTVSESKGSEKGGGHLSGKGGKKGETQISRYDVFKDKGRSRDSVNKSNKLIIKESPTKHMGRFENIRSSGSVISGLSWTNYPAEKEYSELVTVKFDLVRMTDDTDALVGVSEGSVPIYKYLAANLLIHDGHIHARDGKKYQKYGYKINSGEKISVRMEMNMRSHTYDVYITRAGKGERLVFNGFKFRNTRKYVESLDNFAVRAKQGGVKVSNIQIRGKSQDKKKASSRNI